MVSPIWMCGIQTHFFIVKTGYIKGTFIGYSHFFKIKNLFSKAMLYSKVSFTEFEDRAALSYN